MSLDTAITQEERTKKEIYKSSLKSNPEETYNLFSKDLKYILRTFYENILVKQGVRNKVFDFDLGPFEYDLDILGRGKGGYLYRKSRFKKTLENKDNRI